MFSLAKAVVHFNKNGREIRSRISLVYLSKGLDVPLSRCLLAEKRPVPSTIKNKASNRHSRKSKQ